MCVNNQLTNNFDIHCMHVAATYVQFAWTGGQTVKKCLCGHQLHAKFACAEGHNAAKPPVFCNDAGKTII